MDKNAERVLALSKEYSRRYQMAMTPEFEDLIKQALDEACAEAVRDIAAKQALVHGESVTLGGKLVTNEELYKQPVDYVKEGILEGLRMAAKLLRNTARVHADRSLGEWVEYFSKAIEAKAREIK